MHYFECLLHFTVKNFWKGINLESSGLKNYPKVLIVRNGMDLTEAKDIKKRWQEYTEELYKKDLHNPDNHDGVITHLYQTF